MSTETLTVDKNKSADDLKNLLKDKLNDNKINEAAALVANEQKAYPATGSILSVVFYIRVTAQVTIGNKTHYFTGNAGGFASVTGGALFGHIYTDNIDAVFSNTETFAFYATPVYTAVYFFDKNHSLLGHFQAGSVSLVTGGGGGIGSWS